MHAELPEDDHPPAPLSAAQVTAFWNDFSGQLTALAALDGRAFVEAANALLQRHAPGLSLELEGTPGQDGARLVVTAHGNIEHFEAAQAVVRQAPPLAGYAVQAFRSRAAGSNFAMRLQDFELSCDDVLVAHYDAGGIIGLALSFAQAVPPQLQEQARHMAFILLDHALGEWDFAVRVGPVEFVDAQADAVPLSQFPAVFDAFQREVLGRTYDFPQEEQDRWISLEVRPRDADEDDAPDLLTFHDSAHALATRADLSYLLTLRFPVDSQESLDCARAAQDALDAQLLAQQRGVQAFTRMEGMQSRVAAFYVDDPDVAAALARQLAAEHAPGLDAALALEYDPSWREYLGMYSAIHRHDRRAAEEAA